jgi:hypothetical protein
MTHLAMPDSYRIAASLELDKETSCFLESSSNKAGKKSKRDVTASDSELYTLTAIISRIRTCIKITLVLMPEQTILRLCFP